MLRNTGAGVSDCAGDGLIIDADVEPLSGTISAYQGIGRMGGLIMSTIIGQQLADRFGFEAVLIELGFWMLLTAPVAAIVREELEASPLGRRVNAAIKRAADTLSCGGRLGAALDKLGRALRMLVPAPVAGLVALSAAKAKAAVAGTGPVAKVESLAAEVEKWLKKVSPSDGNWGSVLSSLESIGLAAAKLA